MKVSALKTMSLFEYYKGVFSTAMAIFQSPFLSLTSPTFQTTVVLEATRVWIQFFSSSGVVEFMYYSNSEWSLLPWLHNNPKGVGPSQRRSNTLI